MTSQLFRINARLVVCGEKEQNRLARPEVFGITQVIPDNFMDQSVDKRMAEIRRRVIDAYCDHFHQRIQSEPKLRVKVGHTKWQVQILNLTYFPLE